MKNNYLWDLKALVYNDPANATTTTTTTTTNNNYLLIDLVEPLNCKWDGLLYNQIEFLRTFTVLTASF